ncbi:MAG: trigger factor [Patescibacteria group bacterium]
MNFSFKKLPKSQLEIEIDIPTEEFNAYKIKAITSIQKNFEKPGFRPGKAPLSIVEVDVGQERISIQMAQLALVDAYRKVVEEKRLDALGEPEVKITKMALGNPFVAKITLAVLPEVELPDYRKLASAVQKKQVSVQEQDIQEALSFLQENRKREDGSLPEISDDFARSLGNFQDLATLKEILKGGLQQEKEIQESERISQEILESISKATRVEIPEILIEREKGQLLKDVKKETAEMLQVEFGQYLQKINKTEQELLASFESEAQKRIKKFFILREIAMRENIGASGNEIEEEVNRILQHYEATKTTTGDVDLLKLREYTKDVIQHEKTLRFLEGLAKPFV